MSQTPSYYGNSFGGGQPVYDVKFFGAVGDGVTDDTAAIQAAITASGAASNPGVVFFPASTYIISAKLNLLSGVTLQGAGAHPSANMMLGIAKALNGGTAVSGLTQTDRPVSVIKAASSMGASSLNMFDTFTNYNRNFKAQRIGIFDLRFDMSAVTTGTGSILFLNDTDYAAVERCHFYSSRGFGLNIGLSSSNAPGGNSQVPNDPNLVQGMTIRGCWFETCGQAGAYDSLGGGYHTDTLIERCIFYGCYGTALDQVYAQSARIVFNWSIAPTSPSGTGFIRSDFGMRDSVIGWNNFYNAYGVNLAGLLTAGSTNYFGTCDRNLIIGNRFINCPSSVAPIEIESSNISAPTTFQPADNRIVDNFIDTCFQQAIALNDCVETLVQGNTIRNWNTGGATSGTEGAAAISLSGTYAGSGSQRNYICDNVFDSAGSSSATDIFFETNSPNTTYFNRVENNDLTGVTSGGTKFTPTAPPANGYQKTRIANNRGYNPLGGVSSGSFPSGTGEYSGYNFPCLMVVSANGATISDISIATRGGSYSGTGAIAGSFMLDVDQQLRLTYTGGTPTVDTFGL